MRTWLWPAGCLWEAAQSLRLPTCGWGRSGDYERFQKAC